MHNKILLALAAAVALTMACNVVYEEPVDMNDPAFAAGLDSQWAGESAQSLAGDDFVIQAAKDCSVSITCANGTTKACSGTLGRCSASGSGNGSVTCNGSTQTCPSTSSCVADGFCDFSCSFDPDCNDFCVGGSFCFSESDCGFDGTCNNGRCLCF